LKKRLSDHNAGKSKHTAAGRPWRLVPYVALREREKALSFERCLKVGSGHAFARRHF
jgi:putative endonuclease